MVNEPKAIPLSKEEIMERQYREKRREITIGRMRASVVRNQIVDAYSILENVRFDYVADTAFRDKIVSAKKGLEGALSDFLLDDSYWKEKKDEHSKLSIEEYDELLNTPLELPKSGKVE